TSFAFILGLYPLVVASGASQLARRDVGTPVFGGMILASFIGIFAIPPLYVMFQAIRERLRPSIRPEKQPTGRQSDRAKISASRVNESGTLGVNWQFSTIAPRLICFLRTAIKSGITFCVVWFGLGR